MTGAVKRFGPTGALDGLDLRVEAGQVHGFLGPNGSGKSTTIRVLLGLLRPDAGTARLLGGDPWADAPALHRRLAYVPGDVSLWPNLSGGEIIDLLGRARGGLDGPRRAELIDRFELDPTKKGRSYSKGSRQEVLRIAGLSYHVDLLLVDGPTSGLHTLRDGVLNQVVAAERDREQTVLLSSHILSEVESLCDHVSIIRAGKLVESGTLADLRHLTRTLINVESDSPPRQLAEVPGVHEVQVTGRLLTAQVDATAMGEVLGILAGSGVRSFTATPPTLEELFLRHYDGTS